MQMTKPNLAIAALLLLAALVYWSGLTGPLLFDDTNNLAPIAGWVEGHQGWHSVIFGNESGRFGRPVSMASLLASVALFGPGVWGLKLGNLLIHLVNGVVVYLLFCALMRRRALTREPSTHDAWLPVLGTALWLLHPLLVSTVLYVVQRMAMLSAMFTLMAMLAYVQGRIALDAGERGKAWRLLLLVPVCTLLATLSKENGVLAPVLCGVIELFAFAPEPGTRRHRMSTAFVAGTVALPALLVIVLTALQVPAIVGGYGTRPFTLVERLLTQPRVLWDYIGALLLPYGPKLGLYHDDYPVSHALLGPDTTLISIVAWLATIAAAWRLRTRLPGFALGTGIFLVGQSLESSVFPLLLYFEHRNYLPAVGAIWALLSLATAGAQFLRNHMHHGQRVFAVASVGLVLALALATAARAGIWGSEATLLAQGLHYHPDSRWMRMDATRFALKQQPPRLDEARRHLDYMMAMADSDTRRMGAAARLLVDCSSGVGAKAGYVQQAFGGSPASLEADLLVMFEGLAEVIGFKSCPGLSSLQMARQLDGMLDRSSLAPREFNIRRLRFKASRLYLQTGRNKDALRDARLAYDGKREDAPIAALIAELEIDQGHYTEAARMIDLAASTVAPDNYTAQKTIEAVQTKLRSTRPAR